MLLIASFFIDICVRLAVSVVNLSLLDVIRVVEVSACIVLLLFYMLLSTLSFVAVRFEW